MKILKICFSRLPEFEDWQLPFKPIINYFLVSENLCMPLIWIVPFLGWKMKQRCSGISAFQGIKKISFSIHNPTLLL